MTSEAHAKLPDGTEVVIRPLHAGDERQISDGFAHLSIASRRLRFVSAPKKLPNGHVESLVHADGVDHLAWGIAAVVEGAETGIGVARVIRDPKDPQTGEFAITIADEWQHRGAGLALAKELAAASRAVGIHRWLAVVLLENHAVLHLLRDVAREIGRSTSSDGSAEILYAL